MVTNAGLLLIRETSVTNILCGVVMRSEIFLMIMCQLKKKKKKKKMRKPFFLSTSRKERPRRGNDRCPNHRK